MGTLRSHTIRHSGVKPIACPKCPKRFFSNADLRKHMDVHSDAKYICNMCGATLSSKRSLDEHRSIFRPQHQLFKLIIMRILSLSGHRHRKAEEQTCDLCSMKFRTIYNLKRHLLTHTGEKRKSNLSSNQNMHSFLIVYVCFHDNSPQMHVLRPSIRTVRRPKQALTITRR